MRAAIRQVVMEAYEKNGEEVEEWERWRCVCVCVVVIMGGQEGEGELTAFVTVRGV